MIILDVNKINKTFGFGKLLEDVSFSVNEKERIAIVGDNGCGKSTLLKIIAKYEHPDSGTISLKKDCVVEYLEQGDVADSRTGTCYEILNSAFEKLHKMEKVLKDYELKLQTETNNKDIDIIIKRYCNLQEEFTRLGGYEIDVQLNTIINGLKIDKKLLNREFNTLSGGERTLINMARILLSKPDLLLLDEPTNHLDIYRNEWLEDYINKYNGTVIIVSHDRYFLDKVAKKVIEIERGKIKQYIGNYSSYLQQKEDEETKEFQIYKVQQKKIEEMEKAIARLKEWGKLADNPTFFRRAKAIQSNLNRLKETAIEKPQETKTLPINFVATDRGSQNVVAVKNLKLIAENKVLLNNANATILNGEKVAIIGINGCGKTTLINSILKGDENIKLGSNLHIGYLSQIIEFGNKEQTLLQYFIEETGIYEQLARSILFNFQFYKSDATKRVGNLSGGEKLRLKLAIMLQQDINFLILDEPTNHIDISTREVLEETLTNFKGTLLFVSHDRFFINKVANKVIEFYNNKLYTYNGNYNFYLTSKENIHNKY